MTHRRSQDGIPSLDASRRRVCLAACCWLLACNSDLQERFDSPASGDDSETTDASVTSSDAGGGSTSAGLEPDAARGPADSGSAIDATATSTEAGIPQTDASDASPSGPFCGDGKLSPGEQCDEGEATEACNADCTFAQCGDGVRNSNAGEQCDDGGQSALCNRDCTRFSCPTNCECFFRGGSTYFRCDPLPQNAAAAACGELGASLAEIETLDEHRFLAARSHNERMWLGGTDSAEEGTWVWPSGATFWVGDGTGSAQPSFPTVWGAGEPNDFGAGQDCLRQHNHGSDPHWDDFQCEEPLDYVCERRHPPLTTCGDGVRDSGEMCDDGATSETCDADCTAPVCGDGFLNELAGELCDDNNKSNYDACDADCQPTGLVAHWKFTESTGNRYRDRIGEADWTPSFDITTEAGVSLNGTGNLLRLASPPFSDAYQGLPPAERTLTLVAKLRLDQTTESAVPVVFHGGVFDAPSYGVWLDGDSLEAGILGGPLEPPLDVLQHAIDWLGDGEVHQVAVSFSTDSISLFVDAAQVATQPRTEQLVEIAEIWHVGGLPGVPTLTGYLNDLRFYERALTEADLAALNLAQ